MFSGKDLRSVINSFSLEIENTDTSFIPDAKSEIKASTGPEKLTLRKLSEITAAKIALHEEIKQYPHTSLRKQMVYFSNCSHLSKAFLPATHGTVLIASRCSKGIKAFASALPFSISPMHAPYYVSNSMVTAVTRSGQFDKVEKLAMKNLRGIYFPSTEHFFRELLTQERSIANSLEKLGTNSSMQAAINGRKRPLPTTPEGVLDEILHYNAKDRSIRKYNQLNLSFNANIGRGVANSYPTHFSLIDQKFFEAGVSTVKAYPNIDPEILRDIFNQQVLSIRYIEEKAGIGKTISPTITKRPSLEVANPLLNLVPEFNLFPAKRNLFSSNCNKAAASLLQIAENKSAHKQGRQPETISSPTLFGYGASQRVFLWEPLNNGLRRQLFGLLGITDWNIKNERAPSELKTVSSIPQLALDENKPEYPIDFQLFVDNKNNIMRLISTLPPVHQKSALLEILNPGTILGKVFRDKPSYKTFSMHGNYKYICQAEEMLGRVEVAILSSRLTPGH